MITPFRVLEEEIFPEVHSYVIHELKNEKQNILAEKLGITQAMVSKYLSKKPIKNKLIEIIGGKTIEVIRNKCSNEEISHEITEFCFNLMQKGELCEICSKKNNLKNCNACMNLNISEEKTKIIENLKKAVEILEKENPIELMPNVMMNIAMKTENAQNKEEIASIPGRIVKINNKVKASNSPEFGSSSHLASILLKNGKFKAVMNIKYDSDIESSIKKNRMKDVLIDKGGFGVEPCAYVFGNDAVDAVNKALEILK